MTRNAALVPRPAGGPSPSVTVPAVRPAAQRIRPFALAPGASFFALTWLVGVGIARLTGAAAVVLVLAASVGGFVAALLEGRRAAAGVTITGLTCPTLTTVDNDVIVAVDFDARRRRPRSFRLVAANGATEIGPASIGLGECTVTSEPSPVIMTLRFTEPGVVETVRLDLETAGASASSGGADGSRCRSNRFWLPLVPSGRSCRSNNR